MQTSQQISKFVQEEFRGDEEEMAPFFSKVCQSLKLGADAPLATQVGTEHGDIVRREITAANDHDFIKDNESIKAILSDGERKQYFCRFLSRFILYKDYFMGNDDVICSIADAFSNAGRYERQHAMITVKDVTLLVGMINSRSHSLYRDRARSLCQSFVILEEQYGPPLFDWQNIDEHMPDDELKQKIALSYLLRIDEVRSVYHVAIIEKYGPIPDWQNIDGYVSECWERENKIILSKLLEEFEEFFWREYQVGIPPNPPHPLPLKWLCLEYIRESKILAIPPPDDGFDDGFIQLAHEGKYPRYDKFQEYLQTYLDTLYQDTFSEQFERFMKRYRRSLLDKDKFTAFISRYPRAFPKGIPEGMKFESAEFDGSLAELFASE
jgi:hypothetical protein